MKNIVALLVVSVAVAVAMQPGFDPKEVVRQVRGVEREAPAVERMTFDDGEFLIDTSIRYVPVPYEQHEPATAFDGTNFLVVWSDVRSGYPSIYATRVTPTGVVLDPAGIAISTAANDQSHPAVAFDGTNYLVVWGDWRSDEYDIYAARVTQIGVVLDPAGIPVTTETHIQMKPAVAFDGANFLVVWEDWRSSDDIYGARVTPAGWVLDPSGIAISTAAHNQDAPAVAFDGTNFLVVWDNYGSVSGIYAARVTPAGVVLDTSGIPVSTIDDQSDPAVAFDGTNSLVVWGDPRSGSLKDIYGARVSRQGTVLDPSGIAVSTAQERQEFPAVAFDGTNFLVTWEDRRSGNYDIYGTRVSQQGTVLNPSGIAISTASGAQRHPAVAFDGTNFLAVWQDGRVGDSSVYAGRVTKAGSVLDPSGFPISIAANPQGLPAVAFDGTNYLVVWTDSSDGSDYDIYAARVTQGGEVLDPSGVPVTTAVDCQWDPAVAFDGTNTLVVWCSFRSGIYSDIYAARVTQGGTVLDTAAIAISLSAYTQCSPAVAFDGTNFLVVWQDNRNNPDTSDVYGTRVTPAGVVLDVAGIPISAAAGDQKSPCVAFDGTNFLVVWQDSRNGRYSDIYASRVTPAGVVLDSSGIAISTATNYQTYPAVAFDGTSFLAVWSDWRSGFRIFGARVTPAGTVLDPSGIPVSLAANNQRYPAVAFDGTEFLVVWEDSRSGNDYDVYGVRVTSAGVVFDSGAVVMQEGDQLCPVLARGSGNQMFLVYQGWAGDVGGVTYDADRIWGKTNPAPCVEESRQQIAYGPRLTATIVSGMLYLPPASGGKRGATSVLLDISGRKVMDLRPGANSTKGLVPGIYFLQDGGRGKTRKVMIVE